MAAIVWADVVDVAPELTSVSLAWQTVLLAFANSRVAVDVFDGEDGPTTRMVRVYLAAHFGSDYRAGSAGSDSPVTSESAGGLARSYATALAAGGSGFATTSYGSSFWLLSRMSAGGPWLAI